MQRESALTDKKILLKNSGKTTLVFKVLNRVILKSLIRFSQSGEFTGNNRGESLRRVYGGEMTKDLLSCCGVKLVLQNLEHHHFIDCFQSKKFFKKKLSDGREIKKEIVLAAYCHNCKHYIIKFLWYARQKTDFWNFSESKDIRGKLADDVFNRYMDEWDLIDIPNPYKDEKIIKHSKKIPWTYYKAISQTTQVPRYMDESANAGRTIYSPVKKINS